MRRANAVQSAGHIKAVETVRAQGDASLRDYD